MCSYVNEKTRIKCLFYIKPTMLRINFKRMAAILNQMNRQHVYHLTQLRLTLLLFFDLRLIFHKFPSNFLLPRIFFLTRPYHHHSSDDSKNIKLDDYGFEPQWRRDFPSQSRLAPKPIQSPVQRILFLCQ